MFKDVRIVGRDIVHNETTFQPELRVTLIFPIEEMQQQEMVQVTEGKKAKREDIIAHTLGKKIMELLASE